MQFGNRGDSQSTRLLRVSSSYNNSLAKPVRRNSKMSLSLQGETAGETLVLDRKRCSEALRLQFAAAGFQHQGMSSSICAWGQPLTRRVSRSVK